ncbi:MAG TPA: phosphate ABC transporter permease PstA [Jatrophihabitans sp.]|nr:phosphate ABC transporter permease PstA [Jatrophihabitans sp.]
MTGAVLTSQSSLSASPRRPLRKVKNSLAAVLVTLSFLIALVPLVWLLWTVVSKGLQPILRSGWFSSDLGTRLYTDPGGGALAAIIGTLEQVAICSVISIPIAVLVGIYLVEYGRGWLSKTTTFMVDILTGIPSIVAALFIYAVFFIHFGAQFAGLYVSIALVMLMIPVVVRTTEEMLKLVPNELREASYALGVPKWRTITRVVLPTAFSGIMTGVVLGIARVAGETAPLLILDKYSQHANGNPFSGWQAALSTMIKDQVNNLGATHSFTGQVQHNYAVDRMWGAALTLIILVMLLNLVARLIARRSKVSN